MNNECPYDFLTQFDLWFYWMKCVEFDGLTPKQATMNAKFRVAGWELCEGFKYGAWSPGKKQ